MRSPPSACWHRSCFLSIRGRPNRDPQRILDIGLAYMVLTALALGLTFHSGPILPTLSVAPQISWIGAIILMFSAIVPSTPSKTLLAGLCSRRP